MLFRLFVIRVLTAAPAELLKLQPIRRRFLVLACYVIAALAITALQHNVIAWHKSLPIGTHAPGVPLPSNLKPEISNLRCEIKHLLYNV